MIPIRHIIFLSLLTQVTTGFCMHNLGRSFAGLFFSQFGTNKLDMNEISHNDATMESPCFIYKKDFPLLLKISPVPKKKKNPQPNHGGITHQLLATMYIQTGLKTAELLKGQSADKVDRSSLPIQLKETIHLASEHKKRVIAGSAVLGVLFVVMFCQKSKINKFNKLKYFIANMINTMRQERLRNYLRAILERSIEKSLVTGFIDIDELERMLTRFSNNDPVAMTVLNQQKKYSVFDTNILFEGTLLSALFFKALVNFDQKALELFSKYNIQNEIDLKIRINNDENSNKYQSLPLYIANKLLGYFDRQSFELFEKKYDYCVGLMVQNNILQKEAEKELCESCMSLVLAQTIKDIFSVLHDKIEEEDNTPVQVINYQKYENLKSLEHILLRVNDDNSVWFTVLKRHERWIAYQHHTLLCEGSLLGMLFFKAALSTHEKALLLFLKHDIYKKLGIYTDNSKVDKNDALLLSTCTNILSSSENYPHLLGPCLDLVLQNTELQNDHQLSGDQKKQLTQYIACALKKSIHYVFNVKFKSIIYGSYTKKLDAKIHEKILLLFKNNNQIITEMLNQYDTCKSLENADYVLYKGTVLGKLFLESALTFNQNTLRVFFKYGIHKLVPMNLFKNKAGDRYLSLPACIISVSEKSDLSKPDDDYDGKRFKKMSSGLYSYLELMIQNDMLEREDQINEFIQYVIQSENFDGADWLKLLYLKMSLQHGATLKNVNPHYRGKSATSFINSLSLHDDMVIPLAADVFLQNVRQCISTIAAALNYEKNNTLLPQAVVNKHVIDCMRLLLSSGVPIKQEEMVDILSTTEKIELLEETFNEEINIRSAFLRFDDQENRLMLLNNIIMRSANPINWMERIMQSKLSERRGEKIVSINTLARHCMKHLHELFSSNSPNKQYTHYIESWIDFIKLFFEENNYLDSVISPFEKSEIKRKNKKLLDDCILKIIEYNYFNQTSDHENSTVFRPFLLYCLDKDNPEAAFPNLSTQGKDLGNIFHIAARSGNYNKTMTDIMEIAKEKKQEPSVLRALTQPFTHEHFNDEHTPFDLVREEVYKDSAIHKETLVIMNNFIDHCRETVATYKKSPHIAYSPWEDEVSEITYKAKKSLIMQIN